MSYLAFAPRSFRDHKTKTRDIMNEFIFSTLV